MVYQLEGRPGLSTALPLGLQQHVMAMFTSNLAPILIIAKLGAIFLSDSECRTWRCNHYCFWYDSD